MRWGRVCALLSIPLVFLMGCQGGAPDADAASTPAENESDGSGESKGSEEVARRSDWPSPATLWTLDFDDPSQSVVLAESVIGYGSGEGPSESEGGAYEWYFWALSARGDITICATDPTLGNCAPLEMPISAVSAAAFAEGIGVVDADGRLFHVALSTGDFGQVTEYAIEGNVVDLAYMPASNGGETLALLDDGTVWWVDGHGWDETIPAFADRPTAHLAVPQPFPLTSIVDLMPTFGGTIMALDDDGTGRLIGSIDGSREGTITTLSAPGGIEQFSGFVGLSGDGDLVQWPTADVIANEQGSLAAVPAFGPSDGTPILSDGGFVLDQSGRLWGFNEVDGDGGALVFTNMGPVGELADDPEVGPFITNLGLDTAPWASSGWNLVLVGERG